MNHFQEMDGKEGVMLHTRAWIGFMTSLVIFISACGRLEKAAPAADLVFHNGFIWTVDADLPEAQAVSIRDGKFAAVGDDASVLALVGPDTQVVDLKGGFAMPGFNDNHVHFGSAARFLEFNIMKTATQDDFVARVREVVAELDEGEWLLGGFWGAYDQWRSGSAGGEARHFFTPRMSLIEEITAAHPVFIRKFDDSAFAANRFALKSVGLDVDAPQQEGIVFERDDAGQPTGIMRGEGVLPLFEPHLPKSFSHKRRLNQTRRALAEIRKYGVTNVSDMSDDAQLAIYRELRDLGELTVRVHFRYPLERWSELAEAGIKVGSGDAWIRLGALKGHIDGIMGNSSARFFEAYDHQPNNRGRWRKLMVDENGDFDEGRFLKYMADADQAGLQLTIHAIGDEANHLLMNYLEELERLNGPRERRFRLVHAQVIAPDDFQRLGPLGIVAEVQPFHLSDDMRWMEERIGADRCRGAYAFKTIVESGAVLSFGTDWPGTSAAEYPINPMLGLYAAVTRQTVAGLPEDGWFPEERIDIRQATEAYSRNTAYANFEEDIKGSITRGKLADMVALSNNLLEIPARELLNTEVLFTVVDGEIVYRRNSE